MDYRSDIARIPTVNDLRACFFCQREDLYNVPDDPPCTWICPRACALVAHKSCLLKWIYAAWAARALKCPQCGTKFQLTESGRSRIFHLLRLGSRMLQRARLVGAVGIYAVAMLYGSWTMKQFVGPEMHTLLLSDNSVFWRWITFIGLPVIPVDIIVTCLYSPRLIPSTYPLWPPIYLDLRTFRSWSRTLWSWPPTTTTFFMILNPLIQYVYRKVWTSLQVRVLGYVPPNVYNIGNTVMWDGWPTRIKIEINNGGTIQQQQRQVVLRSSLAGRITGALLVPCISNRVGAFLLAASKHSSILRQILAVKPQAQGLLGQLPRMLVGGSSISTWTEMDPVWWRNTLGLGLFIVVRDAIELLYLWRAMRELKSNRVRIQNRDFAGDDIHYDHGLDIFPGLIHPALAPVVQPHHAQSLSERRIGRDGAGRSVQTSGHGSHHDHLSTLTDSHPHQLHIVPTPVASSMSPISSEIIDRGDLRQDLNQSTPHQVVSARAMPVITIDQSTNPAPYDLPRLHHRQWSLVTGPTSLSPESIADLDLPCDRSFPHWTHHSTIGSPSLR